MDLIGLLLLGGTVGFLGYCIGYIRGYYQGMQEAILLDEKLLAVLNKILLRFGRRPITGDPPPSSTSS